MKTVKFANVMPECYKSKTINTIKKVYVLYEEKRAMIEVMKWMQINHNYDEPIIIEGCRSL